MARRMNYCGPERFGGIGVSAVQFVAAGFRARAQVQAGAQVLNEFPAGC